MIRKDLEGCLCVPPKWDSDPSWWGDGEILMAVDLGYDESGGGDILIVSVQVAVTEQARKLKHQWNSRLSLANLEHFHAKDFGNYTGGVFTKAGLDRHARHELLQDLARLIHRHAIAGITARVNVSEYDRIIPQRFRSNTGTAYGFLIDMCLLRTHLLLNELHLPTEVNILIERGHANSNQVTQILGDLQRVPVEILPLPVKILTAGLGSKNDHPILQAADMLAYCRWQQLLDGDRAIWNELHKPGMHYRSIPMVCDEGYIRAFYTRDEGAEKVNWYLKQMKRKERKQQSQT